MAHVLHADFFAELLGLLLGLHGPFLRVVGGAVEGVGQIAQRPGLCLEAPGVGAQLLHAGAAVRGTA